MDSLGRICALLFLTLQVLIPRCEAQSQAFQWKFAGNSFSSELQACTNLTIEIQPLNSSTTSIGTPSYSLLAFELGGVPTTTALGSNVSQLAPWQVNHRIGASLLLTVVDGDGNIGGFPPNLFTVAGNDASCLPPMSLAQSIRITPNVTSSLSTCQQWGLSITGGAKPYNLSIAAVNSPVLTNVTMGPSDDHFTYIDRANPGTQLIAAVVDANGQWSVATDAVSTTGSSDISCTGLVSLSGSSAGIADAPASPKSSSAKNHTTAIALGIVFGLVVSLILAAVGGWWWWRRKRRLAQGIMDGQDAKARPFSNGEEQRPSLNLDMGEVEKMVQVDSVRMRSTSWSMDRARVTASPTSMDMASTALPSAPEPVLTAIHIRTANLDGRLPMSATPDLCAPNSTSPAATRSPSVRYRKAIEAHAEAQAARTRRMQSAHASPSARVIPSRPARRSQSTSDAVRQSPSYHVPSRQTRTPLRSSLLALEPEVEADIIIQHQDGGIVEELPPPYLDQYRPGPAVSS
ncbi:hypothetical protein A0H81_07009 [Grifola frondosa]|uniref:Uncharacterized protein n=1 Tax=Grifola frondosa TaxID=5627 RepID=A0A1C7M914_GRIFR|nr:hypothetical protein A0H81_07009 [Grifola frondosa]